MRTVQETAIIKALFLKGPLSSYDLEKAANDLFLEGGDKITSYLDRNLIFAKLEKEGYIIIRKYSPHQYSAETFIIGDRAIAELSPACPTARVEP